jgi:UDP-glucose 4-epimerase
MHNPKALVTERAGFIGSHMVDELLALGFAVVAVDDLSGGFVDNLNKGSAFILGSMTARPGSSNFLQTTTCIVFRVKGCGFLLT